MDFESVVNMLILGHVDLLALASRSTDNNAEIQQIFLQQRTLNQCNNSTPGRLRPVQTLLKEA